MAEDKSVHISEFTGMKTFHIHIKGMVQGVGFRPFVWRVAEEMKLKGAVSNTTNGVHIAINASHSQASAFLEHIVDHAPANALITGTSMQEIENRKFDEFSVIHSISNTEPDLLLTPDIGLCDSCRQEIHDPSDQRYSYAFTTCLNCGPRYSILHALPYDRINTTMHHLHMCGSCTEEYHDIHSRRHYSQTNSCPHCHIDMHYYTARGEEYATQADPANQQGLIKILAEDLRAGRIVAVKGIGGYLLMCDATNAEAIKRLRERKKRPSKPLAVLYPSLEKAADDVHLRSFEIEALRSKASPIVLCKTKPHPSAVEELIAPGLDKFGVMLPYSPLLELIAAAVDKPLVATSGNISGSPIIYEDAAAMKFLFDAADRLLTYDRDIVAPQDDSVVQFTDDGHRIVLRRSRGMAPNYFPNPFGDAGERLLAMGAELKGAFAIKQKQNLFISQYLGDLGSLESQQSYQQTLDHLRSVLHFNPGAVLVDKHPGYHSTAIGNQLATEKGITIHGYQHHKAHFASVLSENGLLDTDDRIMGVIWDGTGYGDDGQIWGGEIFIFEEGRMERKLHLNYFPQLAGDKMSREPRLSALSLLHDMPECLTHIRSHFSDTEWHYYHKLSRQDNRLLTSSMGRLLDGIACLIGISGHTSYEGEAAMKLEALARRSKHRPSYHYSIPIVFDSLDTSTLIEQLTEDMVHGYDKSWIAAKVFLSLAVMIDEVSDVYHINKIAFSGGVFQNALLTDMVTRQMGDRKKLYFHHQLSPNDESIALGQLALHQLSAKDLQTSSTSDHVFSHSR